MASRDSEVNNEQIMFECPSCKTSIELNDEHKKPLDILLKIYICYYCKGIYYIKGLDSYYRIKNKVRYKTWKLSDFQKMEHDEFENQLLTGEILKDWVTEFGGGFRQFSWWTRY